jgi:pyruvate dehydrogenase E2 component (dihydrolipoamide acetyltransferase)
MAIKIGMPNLGHTMESGRVVAWLVPVGGTVARGDLLAVVESDKVSIEVEAPAAGTLIAQMVPLHAEIAVGAAIAYLGTPGETLPEAPTTAAAAAPPADPGSRAAPSPEVVAAPGAAASRRVLASPLARRIAAQRGIDLRGLSGTGPDGLVVRADVERAVPMPARWRTVPLSPARRRIAERMTRAWREIPMVPLQRTVDVTALGAARGALSWTAVIARAAALALVAHPRLNAVLIGDEIRESVDVDLSIAVALPDDLAVPVIRAAQTKRANAIAGELAALVAAARAGRLPGDAQADGSFTLSNLGAAGVDGFQPIVNPPQVAILGIGRVRPAGDRLETSLTLVFDHRALDGAAAARGLADIADLLASPDRILA